MILDITPETWNRDVPLFPKFEGKLWLWVRLVNRQKHWHWDTSSRLYR